MKYLLQSFFILVITVCFYILFETTIYLLPDDLRYVAQTTISESVDNYSSQISPEEKESLKQIALSIPDSFKTIRQKFTQKNHTASRTFEFAGTLSDGRFKVRHKAIINGEAATIFDVTNTFYPYKFRFFEQEIDKKIAPKFLALFGCSFTVGLALPERETLGYYLQSELGENANVYNFAIGGGAPMSYFMRLIIPNGQLFIKLKNPLGILFICSMNFKLSGCCADDFVDRIDLVGCGITPITRGPKMILSTGGRSLMHNPYNFYLIDGLL